MVQLSRSNALLCCTLHVSKPISQRASRRKDRIRQATMRKDRMMTTIPVWVGGVARKRVTSASNEYKLQRMCTILVLHSSRIGTGLRKNTFSIMQIFPRLKRRNKLKTVLRGKNALRCFLRIAFSNNRREWPQLSFSIQSQAFTSSPCKVQSSTTVSFQ